MKRLNRNLLGHSMSYTRITRAVLIVGTLAMTLAATAPAIADQAPRKGNVGLKTLTSKIVDLGPEIAGMQGRQLRLRLLMIEPGGHIGMHSHADRPSVVYFIRGTDTVTFGDGTVKTFKSGDTTSATRATSHAHQNKGNEPVVFVAVDVFHPKK